MTRRLFFVLIMYFATDFAIPFEPTPSRFVIEDMEEAVAAPRSSIRVRHHVAPTPTPPPLRMALRTALRPRTPSVKDETVRREWRTPPPVRSVALCDRPAPPEAH